MEEKIVILKVGGSILSKSDDNLFDFETARKIKTALTPLIDEGYKFILCTGGGYLCRKYQTLVRENGGTSREEHWIGTETCNMHAVMLKIAFGEMAEDKPLLAGAVIENKPINFDRPVLTVGAAEPGHSSDMDSVEIALRSNSKLIISLKNVDGVYSADPRLDKNAKKYDNLSWEEYFGIIKVTEHTPGGHFPVDPVASSLASKNDIKFIILDGENLPNIVKAIKGEDFVGTTIG